MVVEAPGASSIGKGWYPLGEPDLKKLALPFEGLLPVLFQVLVCVALELDL